MDTTSLLLVTAAVFTLGIVVPLGLSLYISPLDNKWRCFYITLWRAYNVQKNMSDTMMNIIGGGRGGGSGSGSVGDGASNDENNDEDDDDGGEILF